jgi:hypothetical protein
MESGDFSLEQRLARSLRTGMSTSNQDAAGSSGCSMAETSQKFLL